MLKDVRFPASEERIELLRLDAEVRPEAERREEGPAPGGAGPAAEVAPSRFLTLRRGPQLMVVFGGRPEPSVVMSLRQTRVLVGLALSPRELTAVRRLDYYSYVFVSSTSRAELALAAAAADLRHSNWSIEQAPVAAMVCVGRSLAGWAAP